MPSGLLYLDYLAWLSAVQLLAGIAAVIALTATGRIRAVRTVWVAVLVGVKLMLTPAVWAVDVINRPNSINPVAGSGSATFGALVAAPYITATRITYCQSEALTARSDPYAGGIPGSRQSRTAPVRARWSDDADRRTDRRLGRRELFQGHVQHGGVDGT